MRPLRERFEVIDRLAGFDLDHNLQFMSAILRHQQDVGIHRGRAGANRYVVLGARVDGRLESTAEFGLEQANYAVMLELLADGPHQDGAHTASGFCR